MDVFGRRRFLRLALIYPKPEESALERAMTWLRSWPAAPETRLLRRSQPRFSRLLRLPHNRRRTPLTDKSAGLQASQGERRHPYHIDKTVRSFGHRVPGSNIEAPTVAGDPVRATRYKM